MPINNRPRSADSLDMDGTRRLWLLLPLLSVIIRRCDSNGEQDDSAGQFDFPDGNEMAEEKTEKFSSYEYMNRKEFQDKRQNIVLFGLHATRNKTADKANVIKVLRLTKVPFESNEIEDVIVLQKDKRYPNAPMVVKFTTSNLQRAIMYRKFKLKNTLFRVEYDLTKRTIDKQKRLLPLRRALKSNNITAYIKLGKIVVRRKRLSSDEADAIALKYGLTLLPRVTDEQTENLEEVLEENAP